MKTSKKAKQTQSKPVINTALNPATDEWEQIHPEHEIPDNELVVPMFWAGRMYVTVPGTEFFGSPWE